MKNNIRTGKTFISVSIVIFISKALGFCRDIVFASIFGTTILTDAFQVIFSFPSLLFSSIGTALSSVNIPDLTYYINSRSKKDRDQYLANLMAQISLLAAILSLAGIVLAPYITRIIAPGLNGEVFGLSVLLTRIMMPTLLFVSLTYVTTGILQVHGYFLFSSAISIPFNLLIILALIMKGNDIVFLGYMTTIGWSLQFLIQLPVLIKEKYKFLWLIDFSDETTANMFRNLIPILLGNSLLQLSFIIDRSYATHLEAGTAAALAFGSNLFITVTSIFIVAMSTVVFPRLSAYCLDKDYTRIRYLLGYVFKIFLFILLPYLLVVIFYHHEIITLVYKRGAFGSKSTAMTSLAFLFYSFAVLGYACQEIFNRVYYALKKFRIPMMVSAVCLALKFLLDHLLFRSAGIAGISLTTSLCLLLYALIMGYVLKNDIGNFITRELVLFSLKLFLPAGGMISVIWLFKNFCSGHSNYYFVLPLAASCMVYLAIAYITGMLKTFTLKEAS